MSDGRCANAESAAVALCTALREPLKRPTAQRPATSHRLRRSVEKSSSTGPAQHLSTTESSRRRDSSRGGRAELEIFSAYLADGDAGDFADAPPPAYPRGLHMPSDRHGNNKTGIGDMNIFPTQAEIFSNVAEFLPSTVGGNMYLTPSGTSM
ncbi:hypothetical protein NHJ13734_008808 [Beauveria thailandica]